MLCSDDDGVNILFCCSAVIFQFYFHHYHSDRYNFRLAECLDNTIKTSGQSAVYKESFNFLGKYHNSLTVNYQWIFVF